MQSEIHAKSSRTGIVTGFVVPDLEEILKNASKEVSFEPGNNGFELVNKVLRLRYTELTALYPDMVELGFNNPKVRIEGKSVDMNKLPDSVVCNYLICLEVDGEKLEIYASPSPWCKDLIIGPSELFLKGTLLLRQAAIKYDFKRWFEIYKHKEEIIDVTPNNSLIHVF